MGKGHKHHNPSRGNAPATTPPAKSTPGSPSISAFPAARSLVRQIALQLAVLVGLSAALGFTFNAANPIGVRFTKATPRPAPAASLQTNFSLISTTKVVAPPAQPASPQPMTQSAPKTALQATLPIPPRLPQLPTNYPKPTVVAPTPRPASNSAPVAVAAPAQTNLNPAPIHWREAKPLVAAGIALLVDVRLAAMYDAGHIPEAVSLPETSTNDEIKAFLGLVPTNLTLIVYCSSTSCSQSLRVAKRLTSEFHFPSVKYMTGGYQEYQQEELAKAQPPVPQPVTN
jgi:rhodanese-related sulfurtransferase